MTNLVQATARDVYRKLNATGIARVDLILVGDHANIIEVNTVPGLTSESIVPKQVRCMGMDLGHVVHMLLQEASL